MEKERKGNEIQVFLVFCVLREITHFSEETKNRGENGSLHTSMNLFLSHFSLFITKFILFSQHCQTLENKVKRNLDFSCPWKEKRINFLHFHFRKPNEASHES